MSNLKQAYSKRPRDAYSRLICLGCRDRRIRCELPSNVEVPEPGELRTVQTPCYRCKRLGIPCVIRQTILGRPRNQVGSNGYSMKPSEIISPVDVQVELGTQSRVYTLSCRPTAAVQDVSEEDDKSLVSQPKRRSLEYITSRQEGTAEYNVNPLRIRRPQSSETVFIIRAIDTLRREHVEEEWLRHLPAHVGHTPALDMSIKALVAACAYARGVPRLTARDCYQALALALNAVQVDMKQSQDNLNDEILAATAMLAPFEGVMKSSEGKAKQHGVLTPLHVRGLAAILAARPASYPVSQLARDILDFNACDSAVMACIQGTPSPFESIPSVYFTNNRIGYKDCDRTQLKILGNELFIRIPRLVMLVRSLRSHSSPGNQLLLDAVRLSEPLLRLQDSAAEVRLLRSVKTQPWKTSDVVSPFDQSLIFNSIKDFEALAYYWQGRLFLLRLIWRLHQLLASSGVKVNGMDGSEINFELFIGDTATETSQLVTNILLCPQYAEKLLLRKQNRLFAHAMVVVWGVAMDVPSILNPSGKEKKRGALRTVLLQNVNIALAAEPELTAEDLNTAADIFTGGQPSGRFAELYGL